MRRGQGAVVVVVCGGREGEAGMKTHATGMGISVTISFLSHVFFLISVVRCPYFSFAPSYQETNRYLLDRKSVV